MTSQASPASPPRPRSRVRLLAAAALTLGVVGALAVAAPSGAVDGPRGLDHGFRERDLVSDLQNRAERQDPNLVNPWGLVRTSDGAIRVSNNGTSTSTVYAGARDDRPVTFLSPVVQLPANADPTGVVRNDTDDFRFTASGRSGPARFIYAGENGGLFAFNPRVLPTTGVQVAQEDNAVFKGLTLVDCADRDTKKDRRGKDDAGERRHSRILVANFRDARIDAFDTHFTLVRQPAGAFRDPSIPAGFAPFDVKNIDDRIFVTYALQNAEKHDDVAGPGNGFIDVFSTRGKLLQHFARRGVLNSPWGLEVAPKGFGKFAGDLLVGNFGDGHINVFDLRTGRFAGTLDQPNGQPIVINGLWGLQRGTARSGGEDSVWFAAGINDENNGLLGTLRAAR
ncbi:TIGR03118 family protein [Streptomyces sp. IMTB 2501]|uniref:TIGR03118 family protein n=1 Tax=Streptomyces sp. IMTB 2501 TaxID=1776340 RepID=UPI00096E1577|nr:TIGR03118 family protein [Streptomyces sp. IMTB 2501]OLZ71522.1 TIGR03118 family protein [Streptomyces sp. IMTB 2501]